MKKKAGIIAILAMMLLVFAGCDNGADTSGSGTGTGQNGPGGDGIAIQMVRIPSAGVTLPATFTMGSDGTEWNAQPAHEVTLTQGFYMGIHEVTQLQWREVMTGNTNGISANPSHFTGDRLPVEQVSWYDILVFANRLSIRNGRSPAYSIDGSTNPDDWGAVPTTTDATWDAVQIVANSTGYRLPTEAQWEFAARAGTTTQWSFGDTADGEYMWFNQNSQSRTQEVGTRLANPWGLYDMHGNVWEWVWDWFASFVVLLGGQESREDPLGAVSGNLRVVRGGSWLHGAGYARSANRADSSPNGRWGSTGFVWCAPEFCGSEGEQRSAAPAGVAEGAAVAGASVECKPSVFLAGERPVLLSRGAIFFQRGCQVLAFC